MSVCVSFCVSICVSFCVSICVYLCVQHNPALDLHVNPNPLLPFCAVNTHTYVRTLARTSTHTHTHTNTRRSLEQRIKPRVKATVACLHKKPLSAATVGAYGNLFLRFSSMPDSAVASAAARRCHVRILILSRPDSLPSHAIPTTWQRGHSRRRTKVLEMPLF